MSAQAGPGLPDFLIIGAPKAGTTALHAALAQHPQLYLSPVKEPKFFMCDGPPRAQQGPGDAHSVREWIWERDRYETLFASAPAGALKGESTPFYLWDRDAHRRISALVPDIKLIAVLRDPVDRAYSNWMHLWSDGLERASPRRMRPGCQLPPDLFRSTNEFGPPERSGTPPGANHHSPARQARKPLPQDSPQLQ